MDAFMFAYLLAVKVAMYVYSYDKNRKEEDYNGESVGVTFRDKD